eukprot:767026-Hanusia_phi.AAC.1
MTEEDAQEHESGPIRYIAPRPSFDVSRSCSVDLKRTSSERSRPNLKKAESYIERSPDGLLSFATLLKAKQSQIKRKIRPPKHDQDRAIDYWQFCHEFAKQGKVKVTALREMLKRSVEHVSDGDANKIQQGNGTLKLHVHPSTTFESARSHCDMAPLPHCPEPSSETQNWKHRETSQWLHVYGPDEVEGISLFPPLTWLSKSKHVLQVLQEVLHVSQEDAEVVREGNLGPQVAAACVKLLAQKSDQKTLELGQELQLESSTPAGSANQSASEELQLIEIQAHRGIPTLIVVLLDAILDQMFPILDMYGDAMEGLALFVARNPTHEHVQLSYKLKARVRQVRRRRG